MWKKGLIRATIAGAALVGILLVVIAAQPSEFAIERSTTIAAPPAEVFPHVNDLQAWDAWSPWKALDPNPRTSISTPSAGKGAAFAWNGNDKIGEGTLTILDSKPNERVDVEQAFVRPFAGKATMRFTLAPEADGTRLTWTMNGTNDFLGKAMCLVMNMETMIGPQFEQGLANIKALAEKRAAAR